LYSARTPVLGRCIVAKDIQKAPYDENAKGGGNQQLWVFSNARQRP